MRLFEAIEMGERIIAHHQAEVDAEGPDHYSGTTVEKIQALKLLLQAARRAGGVEPSGKPVPEWTEDYPCQPGWYWIRWEFACRNGDFTCPQTVLVTNTGENGEVFSMVTDNFEQFENDRRDGPILWCGPIEPPPSLPEDVLAEPDLNFMDDDYSDPDGE